MAKKKTLKKKVQAKATGSKFVEPVIESAKDIWLAGLGAFAVAQEESGKALEQGSKLFDRLVKEGAKIESKTRKSAEDAVDDVRGNFETRVKSVRRQAQDNWDKLEKVFEDRVARALGRIGVPTADEVRELSERVQELSNQVSRLTKASKRTTAAKKATRKTAAKKAAPKKATAKKATRKAAPKKAAEPAKAETGTPSEA